jgi:hypothetical protein
MARLLLRHGARVRGELSVPHGQAASCFPHYLTENEGAPDANGRVSLMSFARFVLRKEELVMLLAHHAAEEQKRDHHHQQQQQQQQQEQERQRRRREAAEEEADGLEAVADSRNDASFMHLCANRGCSARGSLRCARCLAVRYCGQPCQLAAWKEHKKKCRAAKTKTTKTKTARRGGKPVAGGSSIGGADGGGGGGNGA